MVLLFEITPAALGQFPIELKQSEPLSADQERQLPKITGETNSFNQDINKIQIANGNDSTNPTNDVNKSVIRFINLVLFGSR